MNLIADFVIVGVLIILIMIAIRSGAKHFKGEFCVLLGPSGSGKSTLLNIIGGIDNADSGYISINGDKLEDGHFELEYNADADLLAAIESGDKAYVKQYYLDEAKAELDEKFEEEFEVQIKQTCVPDRRRGMLWTKKCLYMVYRMSAVM